NPTARHSSSGRATTRERLRWTRPPSCGDAGNPMRFAYYAKLSAADQRIYRRSDAIVTLPLPAGVVAGEFIERIRDGLLGDDVKTVQRACQALVDALVAGYGVPPIRIRVLARRPSDDYGELHGLYEPEED